MRVESEQLLDVIALALRLDPEQLSLKTSMDNCPEWDSLKQLSIVLTIEDEFDVEVPDVDVQSLTSVELWLRWLNADA